MHKTAVKILLSLALGATPVVMLPVATHAQAPDTQRAYQAGFNNGTNDRARGKALNLKTDNWKGINLQAYQRGYQDGYRRGGNGGPYGYNNSGPYDHRHDHDYDRGGYPGGYVGAPAYGGAYGNDAAAQRAYQAGFNNGVNDRSRNKPLNLRTDNWHGANLQAYERGYQDGYRGGRRR